MLYAVGEHCTRQRGAVLVLQPSTIPRLGGHFTVYWLDRSLFTMNHIFGECQPEGSPRSTKYCDLLWIDGILPPPSCAEGTFFVRYIPPANQQPYEVLISYGEYYDDIGFWLPTFYGGKGPKWSLPVV